MSNTALPIGGDRLLDVVSNLQRRHEVSRSSRTRKGIGQFFTPVPVARLMASMFETIPESVRVLDPGAGAGILTAAVCERIAKLRKPRSIDVHAYETDRALLPVLDSTLSTCREFLAGHGHGMRYSVHPKDFILRGPNVRDGDDLFVYGKDYKPNSRETIRRQILHQFLEARVVDLNPDDPTRATNSGNNCYALTDAVLPVIRAYGAGDFQKRVRVFIKDQGRLRDLYRRQRKMNMIPVTLPDGGKVTLSPGKHNKLQRAIIEQFGPRFAPAGTVLYFGDTAKKHVVFAEGCLAAGRPADHGARQASGRGPLSPGAGVDVLH